MRSYACSIYDYLTETYSEKVNTWQCREQIANEAADIVLMVWRQTGAVIPPDTWKSTVDAALDQHIGDSFCRAKLSQPSKQGVSPSAQVPSFGSQLKRLLEEARIKPEVIAEEVDIQPRNVYRHLAGETHPSLAHVGKYEKALSKRLGRPVHLPHVSKTSKRQ